MPSVTVGVHCDPQGTRDTDQDPGDLDPVDTFVDHHQVYFQGGGSMNGLTPGRMVHFVYQDGSHLAAIVAEVMEPDERYTPLVRLFVLFPVQPHYQTAFYDEGMEVGTWHWIERA